MHTPMFDNAGTSSWNKFEDTASSTGSAELNAQMQQQVLPSETSTSLDAAPLHRQ
jgi:hypothetical protein